MIEVLNNLLNLIITFINECFRFQIDINGHYVSVFTLAISFSAILIIIYLILRGLGFMKGDD